MINILGSIASLFGLLVSILVYLKIEENKKFYIGKRYLEINKQRISTILAISDDKKRCTSSVKNEIESLLVFYKQNYLPIFRKRRERQIVKEIERLYSENGDTLHAIKHNLKLILTDLEGGEA